MVGYWSFPSDKISSQGLRIEIEGVTVIFTHTFFPLIMDTAALTDSEPLHRLDDVEAHDFGILTYWLPTSCGWTKRVRTLK